MALIKYSKLIIGVFWTLYIAFHPEGSTSTSQARRSLTHFALAGAKGSCHPAPAALHSSAFRKEWRITYWLETRNTYPLKEPLHIEQSVQLTCDTCNLPPTKAGKVPRRSQEQTRCIPARSGESVHAACRPCTRPSAAPAADTAGCHTKGTITWHAANMGCIPFAL